MRAGLLNVLSTRTAQFTRSSIVVLNSLNLRKEKGRLKVENSSVNITLILSSRYRRKEK